jgi:hypothetical protein
VTACFTWRKHADEYAVGAIFVDDDHAPLERLRTREYNDCCCPGWLSRSDAGQSCKRDKSYAHSGSPNITPSEQIDRCL